MKLIKTYLKLPFFIPHISEANNIKSKRKIFILKGISSLFSCIIYTFGCYSFWTFGNSFVYLISFRRHYQPNLSFSYGYFLLPIMNITLALTSPIGGIILNKIGGKKTIFLSTLILFISLLSMYFSRSIFIDYIIMSQIGFGLAVGINITRKNVCSYFMNKKALIDTPSEPSAKSSGSRTVPA